MAQTTKHENSAFQVLSLENPVAVSSRVADYHPSYHEIPETDVLVQLRTNLLQLEDLHGRLRFAMAELQTLLRR